MYAVTIGERATVHLDSGDGLLCGAGKNSIDVNTTRRDVTCKSCIRVEASRNAWAGKPAKVTPVVKPFDRDDASTWVGDLPAGYRWVEVDAINGESHLIDPDGVNLSEARMADTEEWFAKVCDVADELASAEVVEVTPIDATPLQTVALLGEIDDWTARTAALNLINQNGRVFVAEVASFGMAPETFEALVKEGKLTLITDENAAYSRYIRTMYTADRVKITQGLPVWDYNLEVGTVDLRWHSTDGWFNVLSSDGGKQSLMNDVRVTTRHPHTGQLASQALAEKVGAALVVEGLALRSAEPELSSVDFAEVVRKGMLAAWESGDYERFAGPEFLESMDDLVGAIAEAFPDVDAKRVFELIRRNGYAVTVSVAVDAVRAAVRVHGGPGSQVNVARTRRLNNACTVRQSTRKFKSTAVTRSRRAGAR